MKREDVGTMNFWNWCAIAFLELGILLVPGFITNLNLDTINIEITLHLLLIIAILGAFLYITDKNSYERGYKDGYEARDMNTKKQ